MAEPELQQPALLDRLIDFDPDLDRDPPTPQAATPAALRDALRRDLEMLLNTRCRAESLPDGLSALDDSLLSFGVGDFFSAPLVTPRQRQAFATDLQRRIALFEPRLENLSVTLQDDAAPERRSLHLRISAEYRMRPGLPPILFESRVDPVGGRFSVSEGRHG
ncbi:MAG: type VI secretion system baseplate subunit TssE [Paracoccus sp. (in: a-proteobacteria)]|uniref:type VI secretion system baseplate subunit TssE n=1 Tax=Paracoccus sp. TaxID=267 RepID=UPI0026E0F6DA|nr:type VI secretion system baseplate subunit TssE [Paracoccus sp. (in: a-proteobacteria)]MDO5611858.1 type VI secretion system baseplate subunit TssE [Paracoccus sp. (in: a-proteobacteria)]